MIKALLLQVSTPSGEATISVQTAVLCIVVVVLALVVKELAVTRRRVAALEEQLAKADTPPASPLNAPAAAAPVSSPNANTIDPEVVAAISAAVHLTYGSRHRILSITAPPPEHVQAWSTEGRRQVFQSHRVR